MASTEPFVICEMCAKPSSLRCSGCRESRFCSSACQKEGWSRHKLLCKSFANFSTAVRPGRDHYRAIYLAGDAEDPRFVWLQFDWKPDVAGVPRDVPKMGSLLGGDGPGAGFKSATYVETHLVNNYVSPPECVPVPRELPHTLVLQYRSVGWIDDSAPNRAVTKIVTGDANSSQSQDWKGPLVVFAMKGTGKNPMYAKDVGMTDFKHLIDGLHGNHFRTTHGDDCREGLFKPQLQVPDELGQARAIPAVRLNCHGDEVHNHRPSFELVLLPSTHSVFQGTCSPPVSELIELPLLMKKLPHDRSWRTLRAPCCVPPFENPWANELHMSTTVTLGSELPALADTRKDLEGWPSHGQCCGLGSVLIVRKDKKPLHPDHVEAMSQFCGRKLGPLMMRANGAFGEDKKIDQATLLRQITRAKFEEYFDTWMTCQEDEDKRLQISPYRIEGLRCKHLEYLPFVEEVDMPKREEVED